VIFGPYDCEDILRVNDSLITCNAPAVNSFNIRELEVIFYLS